MIFKNLVAKIALTVILGASVLMPIAAMAAVDNSGATVAYKTPSIWPTGFWGPLTWCTGNYLSNTQQIPVNGQTPPACNNLCDLIGAFINVIYFAMSVAIFIITPISLVVGSIMVLISGANPEMLGSGKRVLKGTVIGLVIVLFSYLIVATIVTVLGITGVGGFSTSVCGIAPSTSSMNYTNNVGQI